MEVREGKRPPAMCCKGNGLRVFSWNMGGIDWEGLEGWVDTLTQEGEWDILMLQETFRNAEAQHSRMPQGWEIYNTVGGARAAPAIAANFRVAQELLETFFGETFVGAAFRMQPVLLVFSWHAPNAGQNRDDEANFDRAMADLDQVVRNWLQKYPGAKVICGADLNCQLSCHIPWVGEGAAGERFVDEGRAEQIYGFCHVHTLKVVSSFWHKGPTRWGIGEKSHEAPAQLDYILAMSTLGFEGIPDCRDLMTTASSDHLLLGATFCFIPKSVQFRRDHFRHLQDLQLTEARLPKDWQPRDLELFRTMSVYDPRKDLQREVQRLKQIAVSETKWPHPDHHPYLKQLWVGLRHSSCTLTRRAYQTLIAAEKKRIKHEKSHYQIQAFIRQNGGGFARPQRQKKRFRIPTVLDQQPDRAKWGQTMHEFYTALYTPSDPDEKDRVYRLMIATGKLARNLTYAPKIRFTPEQVRAVIQRFPCDRAAGIDGVPSNVWKILTFRHHIWMAEQLTCLVNQPFEPNPTRPPDWDHAAVSLLPKFAQAESLADHRPIALICQSQKLWERLLADEVTSGLEGTYGDFQYGFRQGRQCAELVATLLRIRELARQWNASWVFYKVDVKKAFDMIWHSRVIAVLLRRGINPRLVYAIGRELTRTYQHIRLHGKAADGPVKTHQGIKQGSPLSGLLFIATVGDHLQVLQDKWRQRGLGIWLEDLHICQLLFADDLVLVGRDGQQIKEMLGDLRETFSQIGLSCNESKLAFVFGPNSEEMRKSVASLPGTDMSETGIKILGRLICGHNQYEDFVDMRQKQAKSWNQYHLYRPLLHSHASLKKKFAIVQNCILSVQLWMAETWRPTQRLLSSLRGFHLAVLRAITQLPDHAKVEGLHKNVAHSRWIKGQMEKQGYVLADELFLQRYYKWGGHVARAKGKHVHHVHMFRDQWWWEYQQSRPEGYRHQGTHASTSTWEGPLAQMLGSSWKESAQDRERWVKLLPHFLREFKRKIGQDQEKHSIDGQVTLRASTVAREKSAITKNETPLVPLRESTRAPLSEKDTEEKDEEGTHLYGSVKETIQPCFPDEETYDFACSLESSQQAGRRARKRDFQGKYVRYQGKMKRLSQAQYHSKGILASKGIDLWRPWPSLRRKHVKRKLEHIDENTMLIDLQSAQVAGQGQGGSDVFKHVGSTDQSGR